ncbi:MAG: hypothetical protein U5M23_09410 [Marinagarivorans sp.]|nr:hypothetical protein [Marinagarivorans sp.]
MTSPKNTSSDRRTTSTQQESSDLDAAITELHQTIIRLNNVIEQVKTIPAAVGRVPKTTTAPTTSALSITADTSQNKPLTLLSLVIPKILH